MPVVVPNIWEQICKEFAAQRPPFETYDPISIATEPQTRLQTGSQVPQTATSTVRFNNVLTSESAKDCEQNAPKQPTRTNTEVSGDGVTYGSEIKLEVADSPEQPNIDTSDDLQQHETKIVIQSPSCDGGTDMAASREVTAGSIAPETSTEAQAIPPPLETCLPREYLQHYILPVLLPALEEMLKAAEKENCFVWKRVKFNALDFLTEYLYGHNPLHGRGETELGDIPFVAEHWKEHPRPPLPKSLVWTEEESTLIIQSYWRGYQIRKQDDVQELRMWQKDWREENESIKNKVDDFWAKQMPESCENNDNPGRSKSTSRIKSPIVEDTAGEHVFVKTKNIEEGQKTPVISERTADTVEHSADLKNGDHPTVERIISNSDEVKTEVTKSSAS